jgi:hypothetical protein
VTGGRFELSVKWQEKKDLFKTFLSPKVPVSDGLWEECSSFLREEKIAVRIAHGRRLQ